MQNDEKAPSEQQAQAPEGKSLEDIVADEAAPERAEVSAESTPDELKLLLEDARAKADDHWNQLLRARAKLDNLRKRSEREVANAHKYGMERHVQ